MNKLQQLKNSFQNHTLTSSGKTVNDYRFPKSHNRAIIKPLNSK